MNIRVFILILLLALAGIAVGQQDAWPSGADEHSERKDLQREILAELSGHGQNDSEAGVRSSPLQRAAAADWLLQRLNAAALTPERHDYRQRNVNGLVDLLMPPLVGTNIHATVEATFPEAPYVVIGAHYDSDPGSPGAGDNASGVALVYTIGRQLLKLDERRFNYLLVFFDQEEDDEVGSKAFARFLDAGGFDVHSVHITDLSGWDDDDDGEIDIQSPTPRLERHYRRAADRLGIPVRITTGASSDNKSFLEAGYATVGVFGDITRHLHKPTDTFETVDFEFLDRMTSLIFDVVTKLSDEINDDAP